MVDRMAYNVEVYFVPGSHFEEGPACAVQLHNTATVVSPTEVENNVGAAAMPSLTCNFS